MANELDDLADDLMTGITPISKFLGWPPRKTYYEAEKGRLPLFKVGERIWCGRKSTLRRHIEKLEQSQ